MSVPYLPEPPSEWDATTTIFVAALHDLYNDLKERARKKGGRKGPPGGLSQYEQHLWNRAAGKEYALLDEEGKLLQGSSGNPIRFAQGDKDYEVASEDFQRQVNDFWDSESPAQYRERLLKLGLTV